jgi:hypothetical protein
MATGHRMASERVGTLFAMAAAGITLIKTFTYRGAPEEWSNTYHLDGHPTTDADWRTAVDDLISYEKSCYSPRTEVVRALCYEDTDADSVYTYILADFAGNVPGILPADSGPVAPGDCAVWVRWNTGLRSSSGKAIYLRKYFHDVMSQGVPNEDLVEVDNRADLQTFALNMLTAEFDVHHLADSSGRRPDGPGLAGTYITTRTLKRRGPRP